MGRGGHRLVGKPGPRGGKEVAATALHQPRSAGWRMPLCAPSGVGGRGAGTRVPTPPPPAPRNPLGTPAPPAPGLPAGRRSVPGGSPPPPCPLRSRGGSGRAREAGPGGARGDPEAPGARPRPGPLTPPGTRRPSRPPTTTPAPRGDKCSDKAPGPGRALAGGKEDAASLPGGGGSGPAPRKPGAPARPRAQPRSEPGPRPLAPDARDPSPSPEVFVSSLCNREVQAGGGREPPGREVRKFAAAAVHWRAAPLSSFLRKVNFIFTSPHRGRGSNKRLFVSVPPAHPGVQTTRAGGSGGEGLRGRQLGLQASAGWRQEGKAGTLPTPHPKGRPEGREGGSRLAARGSNALAIPSVGQVFTASVFRNTEKLKEDYDTCNFTNKE
ncbi:hypothetical protein R6Z07M_019479 [Ovis aries]